MIARLFVIALLACGLAGATTIVANVDWNLGGSLWMYESDTGNTYQWFVGVISITLDQNGVIYNRDTICADLFTDIYVGTPYNTEVLTPNEIEPNPAYYEREAWLIDNVYPGSNDATTQSAAAYLAGLGLGPATQQQLGEAIQLTAWDIVEDGGDGFYSGKVQASSDPNNPTDPVVLALATYYESVSQGKASNLAFMYQNTSINGNVPAQLLEGPQFLTDDGPNPLPEPSTFALAGLGLAAAAFLAHRKKTAR